MVSEREQHYRRHSGTHIVVDVCSQHGWPMNVTIGLSRAGFVEVITVATRLYEHISGWENIDTQLAKLYPTFREFNVHVSPS